MIYQVHLFHHEEDTSPFETVEIDVDSKGEALRQSNAIATTYDAAYVSVVPKHPEAALV